MEEDVKNKLEELERRFETYEKRLNDFKWYLTGFAALLGVIFTVLTVVGNSNFKEERASLRDIINDVKQEMGKIGTRPELSLLAPNKQPIEGQEVPAHVSMASGRPTIHFDPIYQNTGEMSSGKIYLKFYTNDPLTQPSLSSDESGFKYEATASENAVDPKEYPGNFSMTNPSRVELNRPDIPPPGRYPIMMKLFYGKGDSYKASFFIVIPQSQEQSVER